MWAYTVKKSNQIDKNLAQTKLLIGQADSMLSHELRADNGDITIKHKVSTSNFMPLNYF